MITKEQRQDISADARIEGLTLTNNDFAFYGLSEMFGDEFAYKMIFDKYADDKEISDYANSSNARFVRTNAVKVRKDIDDISFEDNRKGMIADLRILEDTRNSITDPKELATITGKIFDARKALNDKFGSSEKINENRIVVCKKFDFICPHTRRECYQLSRENFGEFDFKEAAMKRYNLVEKDKQLID